MQVQCKLKLHEVTKLFPEMDTESFEVLVNSISRVGQLESIKVINGEIVDGRHRWKACKRLKIEPKCEHIETPPSVVDYVIALNRDRRHLTKGQAALIAADALPYFEAEGRAAMSRGGSKGSSRKGVQNSEHPTSNKVMANKSTARAGKAMDVSHQSVAIAKKIKERAPELAEEVKAGRMTLHKADQLLKAGETKPPKKSTSNGRPPGTAKHRAAMAETKYGYSIVAPGNERPTKFQAALARALALDRPVSEGEFWRKVNPGKGIEARQRFYDVLFEHPFYDLVRNTDGTVIVMTHKSLDGNDALCTMTRKFCDDISKTAKSSRSLNYSIVTSFIAKVRKILPIS